MLLYSCQCLAQNYKWQPGLCGSPAHILVFCLTREPSHSVNIFFFFFFFTKAFFTFIKVILNVWLQGVHHRSDTGRQIGNIGACFHLLSIPALHSTKSHAYSQHVPQIVQIIQDSTKDVFLFFFKFHAIQDIFTIFKK